MSDHFLYIHRVVSEEAQCQPIGPDKHNAIRANRLQEIVNRDDLHVVDFEILLAGENRHRYPANRIALTFDDGYRDFIDHALPLIERLQRRVLLFVTTGFLDSTVKPYEYQLGDLLRQCHVFSGLDGSKVDLADCLSKEHTYEGLVRSMKTMSGSERYEAIYKLSQLNGAKYERLETPRMLTWSEIEELDQHPLVELGAHTVNHLYLPALGPLAVWKEIYDAKHTLESRLNHQIRYFAYPYGGNSWFCRLVTALAGFEYAFSTNGDSIIAARLSRMAIPRLDVRRVEMPR